MKYYCCECKKECEAEENDEPENFDILSKCCEGLIVDKHDKLISKLKDTEENGEEEIKE